MGEEVNRTTNQEDVPTEKWWKVGHASQVKIVHSRRGEACPKCYLADLDYDTLFRLHCPNCGYIAECGAFT